MKTIMTTMNSKELGRASARVILNACEESQVLKDEILRFAQDDNPVWCEQ